MVAPWRTEVDSRSWGTSTRYSLLWLARAWRWDSFIRGLRRTKETTPRRPLMGSTLE
ncbi:hypothetical protein LJ114_04535 [Propionibacterium freudenreichii]|uniref:hypothetical protein n=1 Tax=Propionibacterium freudenreichii TaxID=1744 RepID=UPI0022B8653E|nr:hypothetical protein [Propionibacterium freudenreichii]WBF63047.1 hypothetical protein LJ114_04535 [Propionibacterium freudenreichii]